MLTRSWLRALTGFNVPLPHHHVHPFYYRYYKALDDPKGQSAIIKTIDNADREQAFDMFGVVEAQGDSTAGNFTKWIQSSVALQRVCEK